MDQGPKTKSKKQAKATSKATLNCTHAESWEALPVPNERTYRCSRCDALGYARQGPGRRSKTAKVQLYRCQSSGCKQPVIERRYGSGKSWNMQNGCKDHPIR